MAGPETRPALHARRLGAGLVVALILFGVLFAAMDARQAWHLLRHARWELLPAALLCTAISYFSLSAGYAVLNRIFHLPVRTRTLLEVGFVSFALNNLVSVGGLAGYSLRLSLLRRRGCNAGEVVSASLVHSYFNHIVMMALLPAGFLYLLWGHPLGRRQTAGLALASGIAMGLLVLTTVLLLDSRARRRLATWLGRAGRALLHRDFEPALLRVDGTLGTGVEAIRAHPEVLGVPLLFVLADWVTSVMTLGFCFAALGEPLHAGVLLTGFAIGITAGFLSMLPGGLGVQESSMAGVYVLLGVPLEHAVLASLLFRVVYYVVPFGVSLLSYARLMHQTQGLDATAGGAGPA
jgi:uncharacterized protein (TIRG00374 family)